MREEGEEERDKREEREEEVREEEEEMEEGEVWLTYELLRELMSLWEDSCLTLGVTMAG